MNGFKNLKSKLIGLLLKCKYKQISEEDDKSHDWQVKFLMMPNMIHKLV